MKIILAVNSGSSSVKVSVYSAACLNANPILLADAQISGLTSSSSKLTYRTTSSKKEEEEVAAKTQQEAFTTILDKLVTDPALKPLSSLADISILCHRVVHGGTYSTSQIITPATYHHIQNLSSLAPLHNTPALGIIQTCIDTLPPTTTTTTSVNIACFDSQFHTRSMPKHVFTYPVRQDVAQRNGLRKYGFHGISYAFITSAVEEYFLLHNNSNNNNKTKKKEDEREGVNIIALHLGSGASACAIKNSKSWDTSMGLTPLSGLPGATRSGSVDPSLVFHYASNVGKLSSPSSTSSLHISRAEEILNREAGWASLTGTTDFAAISSSSSFSSNNNNNNKLAFDILVDRISAYIGSYYVSLQGDVDALVFAGGIGENSKVLRQAVVEKVGCLGFAVDDDDDDDRHHSSEGEEEGGERVVWEISPKGAEKKVLVCRTDEQLEMARMVARDERLWG